MSRRDMYDDFYDKVLQVKDIGALSFAEKEHRLLVDYTRDSAMTWRR